MKHLLSYSARWIEGSRAVVLETFAMKLCRLVFPALVGLALLTTSGTTQGQTDPEKWLQDAENAYGSVTNYTAILHKQQLVDGKLLQDDAIFIKFRKPFSLYMRWLAAPHQGCELLYVEGWNENRAKVHKGGFWGFVTKNLGPNNPRLMAGNLRPFTDTGLGFLVQTVAVNVRKASKAGELRFYERGTETVYGRETQRLEIILPKDQAKGYDAYRFITNQDAKSRILIRIQTYDWNDRLFENYAYEDLNLEARLTDTDFDPANPDYRF